MEQEEYKINSSEKVSLTLPILSTKPKAKKFNNISKAMESFGKRKIRTNVSKISSEIKIQTSDFSKVNPHLKSFILPEIKYFMTSLPLHQVNILSRNIMESAQQKLQTFKNKTIPEMSHLQLLFELIDERTSDSSILMKELEKCLEIEYPASARLMLLYTGIFFCQVVCFYQKAEDFAQNMFDQIIRLNIVEYLLIFLLIKVRIKSKLLEWSQALRILSKLLIFSWYFKENDLELWCYYEFSKIYFSLDEIQLSEYYKKKSEEALLQPQSNAYRLIGERNLMVELQLVKSQGRNLSFNEVIKQNRLAQLPQQIHTWKQMITDQRKLQSSIKTLNKECGVKYVKDMLNRLSLCNFYKYEKNSGEDVKTRDLSLKFGSHIFRTHQSHIKNMSMFFRVKKSFACSNSHPFYTIENSTKNWIILKQMMKFIIFQVNFLNNQKKDY